MIFSINITLQPQNEGINLYSESLDLTILNSLAKHEI
jgi:hypothetical protein